jgi:hypothetical protein
MKRAAYFISEAGGYIACAMALVLLGGAYLLMRWSSK